MIRNTLCALALLPMLAACSVVSKTPSVDIEVAGATYGIGGTAIPSGTATVSIGSTSLRGVLAPTVFTDASGNQEKLLVENGCGGQNVPSVWGMSNMAGNAGVSTGALPSATLSNGEGMAVGLPADLEAMTDLQKAAGTNADLLKDCTGK